MRFCGKKFGFFTSGFAGDGNCRSRLFHTNLANRNDPKLGTLDFKAKIAL